MKSLYKMATTTKPPKWLGDAGDKAYQGMDNAFKAIGQRMKKKKRKGTIAEAEARNALDV